VLTSRQLANDLHRRKHRKPATRMFYVLTCGAVSSVSAYGAGRTLLLEPWAEPSVSHVVAAFAVFLAMGWFGLLMVQTVLAQLQRTFEHRRIGQFGAALGLATPVVAVAGAILRAREQVGLGSEVYGQAAMMVVVHLLNGLLFLSCLSLALVRREASDFHRRWMLMAMLALVPEGVMGMNPTVSWMLSIYGVLDALLLVAVARDVLRLGRIHRVYRSGLLPVLLFQSVILAVYISRWPALLAVVDSVISGRF
jgi:hypothetical protein